MPAKAPDNSAKIKLFMRQLGHQLRQRRKTLGVSAVTAAEAAGISRMTLHRIERGEASVTLGAYMSVVSVLGLSTLLIDTQFNKSKRHVSLASLPKKINVSEYPQLKSLAWQLKDAKKLSHQDVMDLYERNWRHIDVDKLSAKERELIDALMMSLGRGRLLV